MSIAVVFIAHPLPEVLLLVVCGTVADCDDYEGIAEWGEAHLAFLRRFLPYHHGVPGARWLNILMNRIDPQLFSTAFTAWVRETWPDRPDLVAIDRRFAGEVRLPDVTTIVRVASRAELKDRGRFETRYYVSSAALSAAGAAEAVRSHWAIENSLHWVLDVTFGDDQSRLRTGQTAQKTCQSSDTSPSIWSAP